MDRVLVFGTSGGYLNLKEHINYAAINIIGFIDNDKSKQGKFIDGILVYSIDQIECLKYDYIMIASEFYKEIFVQLIKSGVEYTKILPVYQYIYINSNEAYNNISNMIRLNYNKVHLNELTLDNERKIHLDDGDYIRLSSLELVANEIYDKDIKGEVAELGVYCGGFAKYINELFSDRKLYLFDTFEGFDDEDCKIEMINDFSSKSLIEEMHSIFSDTSIDLVMSKMKYPENCVIKKGYFPNTVEGLEEKFAFVSIDTDLFKPIYEGLKYFYPRLCDGGYIFIHDYNCMALKGVKEAVKLYCEENSVKYFPLSDNGGTVVICK